MQPNGTSQNHPTIAATSPRFPPSSLPTATGGPFTVFPPFLSPALAFFGAGRYHDSPGAISASTSRRGAAHASFRRPCAPTVAAPPRSRSPSLRRAARGAVPVSACTTAACECSLRALGVMLLGVSRATVRRTGVFLTEAGSAEAAGVGAGDSPWEEEDAGEEARSAAACIASQRRSCSTTSGSASAFIGKLSASGGVLCTVGWPVGSIARDVVCGEPEGGAVASVAVARAYPPRGTARKRRACSERRSWLDVGVDISTGSVSGVAGVSLGSAAGATGALCACTCTSASVSFAFALSSRGPLARVRDALALVPVLDFVLVLGAMDGARDEAAREDADAAADEMLGAPLRIVRAVPSAWYHAGYCSKRQLSSSW